MLLGSILGTLIPLGSRLQCFPERKLESGDFRLQLWYRKLLP